MRLVTPSPVSPAPADQESSRPLKDYKVPATDDHGHSARVVLRVPPTMKNLLGMACSPGTEHPWENESEVARWCISNGLDAIAAHKRTGEFKTVHTTFAAWLGTSQVQMEMLHFSRVLATLQSNVDELLQAGHAPAARKVLEAVKEKIDAVDDPYWRTRYQNDFLNRYWEAVGLPKELLVGVSPNVQPPKAVKRSRE